MFSWGSIRIWFVNVLGCLSLGSIGVRCLDVLGSLVGGPSGFGFWVFMDVLWLNWLFCVYIAACGPVCLCGHQDHREHNDRHHAAAVHVRLHRSPALQGDQVQCLYAGLTGTGGGFRYRFMVTYWLGHSRSRRKAAAQPPSFVPSRTNTKLFSFFFDLQMIQRYNSVREANQSSYLSRTMLSLIFYWSLCVSGKVLSLHRWGQTHSWTVQVRFFFFFILKNDVSSRWTIPVPVRSWSKFWLKWQVLIKMNSNIPHRCWSYAIQRC